LKSNWWKVDNWDFGSFKLYPKSQVPNPTSLQNAYIATIGGSFGAKEVDLKVKLGLAQIEIQLGLQVPTIFLNIKEEKNTI